MEDRANLIPLPRFNKRICAIAAESWEAIAPVTDKDRSQLDNFYDFFFGCWEVLHPSTELANNWHIELLCHCCQAVSSGLLKNVVINIQPRSLKSEIVTIAFPCWEWLHKPSARFLCMSYSSSLANTHNQDRRTILRSQFYKKLLRLTEHPDLELREDKNRISEFGNNYRGEMIARGFDGSVTGVGAGGQGGGAIIVDDGNDPNKAESVRVRSETERKFKDYSIGRKNDPITTPVINIQQRCHVDDITGTISKVSPGSYKFYTIPTRAEIKEVIQSPLTNKVLHVRQPSELMHPERFTEIADSEAKATLGSYMYSARHQQNPLQKSGTIFKIESLSNYFDNIPSGILTLSVDASFGSLGETASYVVIQAWIVKRPNFFLYDQVRERLTFPQTIDAIAQLKQSSEFNCDRACSTILIENKANGQAIIQVIRDQYSGVIAINPKESKISRATAASPTYESNNVFLRRALNALDVYQSEHLQFPNATNDDCVDASTQIVNFYLNRWRQNDHVKQHHAMTTRVKTY